LPFENFGFSNGLFFSAKVTVIDANEELSTLVHKYSQIGETILRKKV